MTGLGTMTPLRRLALANGMSRRELAAKAGLSRQTLYNIEGGESASDETLIKLGKALAMEPIDVASALAIESGMAAA